MASDFVECEELSGKTIKCLRIYPDSGDGTELQIDFPDGTTFTCCFSVKPAVEAGLIRPGIGHPEMIRSYDLSMD